MGNCDNPSSQRYSVDEDLTSLAEGKGLAKPAPISLSTYFTVIVPLVSYWVLALDQYKLVELMGRRGRGEIDFFILLCG